MLVGWSLILPWCQCLAGGVAARCSRLVFLCRLCVFAWGLQLVLLGSPQWLVTLWCVFCLRFALVTAEHLLCCLFVCPESLASGLFALQPPLAWCAVCLVSLCELCASIGSGGLVARL